MANLSETERRARGAAQRDEIYDRLVTSLRRLGPDAPTQCEGWVTRDIATHIWLMKHDPIAWPGIGIAPLKELTDRRAQKALDSLGGYDAMLDDLAKDDGTRFFVRGDSPALVRMNLGEWYIHLRDATDPNGLAKPELDLHLRRALWLCLRAVAPLNRADARLVEPVLGKEIVIGKGSSTVVGDADELIMWASGRWADVEITAGSSTDGDDAEG